MSDEPVTSPKAGSKPGSRFLGSLRDALAAAGRDEMKTGEKREMEAKAQSIAATRATLIAASPADPGLPRAGNAPPPLPVIPANASTPALRATLPATPSAKSAPIDRAIASNSANDVVENAPRSTTRLTAAEAARLARGEADQAQKESNMDEPTTRISRGATPDAASKTGKAAAKPETSNAPPRTQLVRGKAKVSRGDFTQDPVVGWLVIVGGPGLGSYRPVFEGNNTIGRAGSQRVPIDFGDDAISSEEQAYIRYDSVDRTFLFVPNLAKTNVVQVNHQKPTGAVSLSAMDVITMGKTQLVFVPFCGADFDWAELSNLKE